MRIQGKFILPISLFLLLTSCEEIKENHGANGTKTTISTVSSCEGNNLHVLDDAKFIPYHIDDNDFISSEVFFYDLWSKQPELYASDEKRCYYQIKTADGQPMGYAWTGLEDGPVSVNYKNVFFDAVSIDFEVGTDQDITPTPRVLEGKLGYSFVEDPKSVNLENGFMLHVKPYNCFGIDEGSLIELKKSSIENIYDVTKYTGVKLDTSFHISGDFYSDLVEELTNEATALLKSAGSCSSFYRYHLKAGNNILKFTDATCAYSCSTERQHDFMSLLFGTFNPTIKVRES